MLKLTLATEKGTHTGLQVDPICSIACDVNGDGVECTVKAPNGETVFTNEGSPIVVNDEDRALIDDYLANQTLTLQHLPIFLRVLALAVENADFTAPTEVPTETVQNKSDAASVQRFNAANVGKVNP